MKKVLVTGCTSGIGKEIVREVLKRGDALIMVNRSSVKSQDLIVSLHARYPTASISLYIIDLSVMEEIHVVGARIRREHPRIDILINNAGAFFSKKTLCIQGWEKTFCVNHMGYFALSKELLPCLEGAPARIVNVASRAHYYGNIDFSQLPLPTGYHAQRVYGTSKLCNILFTKELARRLEKRDISVNCLHPGVVRTGFAQDQGGYFAWCFRIFKRFFISAEEGAKTPIFLAYHPSIQRSGGYYVRCRAQKTSKKAQDPILAQKLWELSERLYTQSLEGV